MIPLSHNPLWTPDKRDFSHSKKFGSLPASILPTNGLGRVPISIKDQKQTLFCTGFGTAAASEYQEGEELCPLFQVAKIGQLLDRPILDGADARASMKAMILFGSLPRSLSPFSLNKHTPEFVANWKNWPEALDKEARKRSKAGYFSADGPYDAFDKVRMALYQGAAENQVVIAFGRWYPHWTGTFCNGISQSYGYHCYVLYDWCMRNGVTYLKIQQSGGKAMGDGGTQYIDRDTFNMAWQSLQLDSELYIPRDLKEGEDAELRQSLSFILWDLYYRVANLFDLWRQSSKR